MVFDNSVYKYAHSVESRTGRDIGNGLNIALCFSAGVVSAMGYEEISPVQLSGLGIVLSQGTLIPSDRENVRNFQRKIENCGNRGCGELGSETVKDPENGENIERWTTRKPNVKEAYVANILGHAAYAIMS